MSGRLFGRRIAVGIPGSVAAYRSVDFVRALIADGAEVRAVPTKAGLEFVGAKALETFTGHRVLSPNMFNSDHLGTDHIELARWADAFVIYGATADFLAKLTHGQGDEFLLLQLLAFEGPVLVAPAMNPVMWDNPATRENVERLRLRGVRFVGPEEGRVACGETGRGHISDLSVIVEAAVNLPVREGPLSGRNVLISAGPMRTRVDAVRSLQNSSSGRTGVELARAARALGANVELLLGPVDSAVRDEASAFRVRTYESYEDYLAALEAMFPACDIFLSAAAVLDFVAVPASGKIPRDSMDQRLSFEIRPTEDLVAKMARLKKPEQRVVAFALESGTDEEILARALEKFERKGVDAVVANPARAGRGPDAIENEYWVLRRGAAGVDKLGPAPKSELATQILKAALLD